MGAEAGRLSAPSTYDGSGSGSAEAARYQHQLNEMDFPNICRREWEAPAWTLLHQCALDRWKDGHAGQ